MERHGKRNGSSNPGSPRKRQSSEHLEEIKRQFSSSSTESTDIIAQLSVKTPEEIRHYESTI